MAGQNFWIVYIKQIRFISISGVEPINVLNEKLLRTLPLKAIFQSLDGKYFFILFYMEFQLYTCKIGNDLERSYVVYARNLGPPESHTIEPAFKRVIP